ncbi:MAG TPA: S16 family serine protease [Gaiella sp.]|nr:S16 family serine protease [Gaiella sp.]
MSPRNFVLAGAALLAVVVFASWTMTSDDFLYVPNEARPVGGSIEVAGETSEDDAGGIYFIDVRVRKARWLEQLVPFVRPDGASLVPGHAVTPPGQTFAEWRVRAKADMERSEQIAAAVAFREAGLDVDATPRGALVEAVAIDVPAAKTLRGGDVIVQAAGKPVLTPGGLVDAIGQVAPGDLVSLRVRRSGKTLERTVRTVAAPDDAKRAIIGIHVSQDARIKLPRDVSIDLGDVGGASAGLPFALEVYQQLGRDVDRGNRVAATGEIQLDGSVAPVGGIKQKTVGVRRSGADVFLVPAGENASTARRYAGRLRIVPVENFRQALRVLKTLPSK